MDDGPVHLGDQIHSMVWDYTSPINQLQSSECARLLDDIGRLRSQGINHSLPLPRLIVCGDQSVGKSSVLEAISHVKFPTKDQLSTCFATELILRKTPGNSSVAVTNDTGHLKGTSVTSVTIEPGKSRSHEDEKRLQEFKPSLTTIDNFPSLVEQAKEAMGTSPSGGSLYDDILRVEVSGPYMPHLSIVDLPGLIHSENSQQAAEDAELVSNLAQSYMANPHSIILAIISATNDYADQIVPKLARTFDRDGTRTLGLITKPDTLHPGSDSEVAFLRLAKNEDIHFRLGWHVLKNRDYNTSDPSAKTRDEAERIFFSYGSWAGLSSTCVGIAALRNRLSKILLENISNELPNLVGEIKRGIDDCYNKLAKLGAPRPTTTDQISFLTGISQTFQSLTRAAIDGNYGDPFFGDSTLESSYNKRLRAVIQSLNQDFATSMNLRGMHRWIVEDLPSIKYEGFPETITRASFIEEIRNSLECNRGCELPGTFSPLVIGDLFFRQAAPWKDLADDHITDIWDAARSYLELVISEISDKRTCQALLREVIDPAMDTKLDILRTKLQELLIPHQRGYPITYDRNFTEKIQLLRHERQVKNTTEKLSRYFGLQTERPSANTDIQLPYLSFDNGKKNEGISTESSSTASSVFPSQDSQPMGNVSDLVAALTSYNVRDMHKDICSEMLDCMEAYYQIAIKVFVDNVAAIAVEGCLMDGLVDILSPFSILRMDADMITRIASESDEALNERLYATQKLSVLEASLQTCKRYAPRKLTNRAKAPTISPVKLEVKHNEQNLDAVTPTFSNYESDLNSTVRSKGTSNAFDTLGNADAEPLQSPPQRPFSVPLSGPAASFSQILVTPSTSAAPSEIASNGTAKEETFSKEPGNKFTFSENPFPSPVSSPRFGRGAGSSSAFGGSLFQGTHSTQDISNQHGRKPSTKGLGIFHKQQQTLEPQTQTQAQVLAQASLQASLTEKKWFKNYGTSCLPSSICFRFLEGNLPGTTEVYEAISALRNYEDYSFEVRV
ncbi:MAG: hypothetical protein M1834_008133 [Cirrosporium novae-zelandiae]|nr:MAG: hypothetical protein M1834_008133 [Cirrosporium novae-zelandiae]